MVSRRNNLKSKKKRMFEIIPSYKTIYNYIEKGILQIKNIDLALKVKRKARNKKGIKNKGSLSIVGV